MFNARLIILLHVCDLFRLNACMPGTCTKSPKRDDDDDDDDNDDNNNNNNNNGNNKSVQSNLGRGPRRCESKSPLVTMVRPKFAPKSTPSRGPIPNPTIPASSLDLSDLRCQTRSAVFPQCTGQTDAPKMRCAISKSHIRHLQISDPNL